MAHLLGTQSLAVLAGSRRLLEDVTLGIEDASRVGILGPNGAGKSTLLRLVAGVQEAASGLLTKREGVRVVLLDQKDSFDPELPVVEAVHPGLAEYEWASDPRVRDIHAGLLADIDLDSRVGDLSGGQRRRVALARVLCAPSEVVCLDEPTNHLDVEGVAWLAAHLNARFSRPGAVGALLVVTHDRWFLDAVCEHIWEVVPGIDPGGDRPQIPGRVEVYDGSYAAYTLARAERLRQADVAAVKRKNLLTKELAWLRRGAPARTSKPKFHIEAAEALIADVPPPRDTVELMKMASARLGKDVLDLEDVTLAFGRPDGSLNTIFDSVTLRLAPGERVGVVGVNGAGKTSLLNLLRGDLPPDSGRVKRGKTVEVATLSQDTHELDALADMRVVEAVAAVAQTCIVEGRELTASQMTERMGFTRQRAYTRIREISGGERRRLQLMRLLMASPNVLLLDEPTNDLDTDTLAAMEDLLDSFPGTLVVVSHDRYLLERVTDHQVALLGDGTIRALPGGVEQYLRLRAEGGAAQPSQPTPAEALPQAPALSDAAARRAAKKEADRIERRLERLRSEAGELEARLEALGHEVASDPSAVPELQEVSARHSRALSEIAELEDAWLQAAELLE
ncbi:MAG: ABC-F family ATP-binding cassette domain-containing protein [Schaalia hyovaginalis]|uniref:ABC-F family ATP-binding cassette domain-containing protein n=1 Tax=Schaalia hyovaginalis TaxID=29316 RepID=UPI002A8098ED|nr:ABC-F family ATP-binding cassette domain-containing protein [Schaalia hyovaginalis]MDY4263334.1 ABC-F family ATP-binding cassette domain-containing protein [Schaalia hyovaginalis]MDY5602026.1 ABC-F family ATP-binding cassette domain-containing protein [Schaalia hyovaginalis]